MSSLKKGLKALYASKLGKLLPVLVIAGMIATASASVFVLYYAQGTATAQTNDVSLVVGGDDHGSACGTITPCVHSTLSTSADFATINLNLGVESSNSPQPQTYFTDVIELNNAGSTSRTVTTSISSATESGTFYGSLTIYYCTATTSNPVGDSNCTTNGAITSNISSLTTVASAQTLAASGTAYIALVGWASATSSSLSFNLQFQWA